MTIPSSQNDAEFDASGMRKPLRKRGIRRVEILLDATEALLEETTDVDISLSLIAERANVPLPSIYHFFPNRNSILVVLAQRFHKRLAAAANAPLDPAPERWQDIIHRRQISGAAYLNRHPAALRLFMGAGVSAEVRNLDLRGNASLAESRAREFRTWFDCSGILDLEHRLAVSIGVMDGIWAISWSQHRQVTDDYLAESTLAATAYLRCFLPEVLRHASDRAGKQNILSLSTPQAPKQDIP
ncbi:MAG: TetR/AcrR family transcriptional regulator [Rhodobacteraceae bacterium]|nr:TetR/AcrR family transcriptional regulator [Paracoccaceae bacterium]